MKRAILLIVSALCILLYAQPASATITNAQTPVQCIGVNTGGSCTITATGSNNILVTCAVGYGGAYNTISSITDGGDTFVLGDRDTSNRLVECWYALTVTAGRTALTYNFGGGISIDVTIWELHSSAGAGIAADGHANVNNQPTTTTPIGASITTVGANDALIAVIGQSGPAAVTGNLANGGDTFTCDKCTGNGGGNTYGFSSLYNVFTGAHQPKWSLDSSSVFGSVTVAFSDPAGATVNNPTFSPIAGNYPVTQTVTISVTTSGATICYTTDGSSPAAASPGTCSNGTTYSVPVAISSTHTLKAIGTKATFTNSSVTSGTFSIGNQGSCPITSQPTAYLTRTDRAVLADTSVPSMGGANGAGTIVTDTTFFSGGGGIKTERITDSSTAGDAASFSNYSWNCDSTKFSVINDDSNWRFYSFNTTTMAFASIASIQTAASPDTLVAMQWANTDPNVAYVAVLDAGDSHIKLGHYDYNTSTYTILHDPISDIPTLPAFGNNLNISRDDNCLFTNIGGVQDLRRYFYVWCQATTGGFTAGARWLDGTTGTISGWGPTGTIPSSVRFGGHNFGYDGGFGLITMGTCLAGSPCTSNGDGVMWDILAAPASAMTFYQINTNDYPGVTIAGHFRHDPNGRVVDDSVLNGADLDFTLRTAASGHTNFNLGDANRVDLIPTPRSPDTVNADLHTTWENSRVGAALPFFNDIEFKGDQITSIARASNVVTVNVASALFCGVSDSFQIRNVVVGSTSFNGTFTVTGQSSNCSTFTFSQSGANESGTVGLTSAAVPIVAHPWDREIIANTIDGSNTIYRMGHIYGPSLEAPSFTLQPSVSVSKDGRWIMFHSDWGQTLGVDGGGVPRTDVFIMKLLAIDSSINSVILQ